MVSNNVKPFTPEDKDQALVETPYGRGMVIRSNRDDGIRETQLTEWEMATKPRGSPPNAMLYTSQKFPSVKPLKGDHVTCQWGRGVVKSIRKDGTIEVQLSSWRLANRCMVKCYLNPLSVQVVRKKTKAEMDVYERVEMAMDFKSLASKQFSQKLYGPALETYAKAVEAVRYVQHNANSSNEVRADLVAIMITCCNNAGTCSVQLHKWDEAIKFSLNALTLLDALFAKRGSRIHSILNKEGYSDIKIFGEWRVKSHLITARALLEKKNYDTALKTLEVAAHLIAQEKDRTPALVTQAKEVKKLVAHSQHGRDVVRKTEKKRAQAMFGGASAKSTKAEKPKSGKDAALPTSRSAPPAAASPVAPPTKAAAASAQVKPSIKPSISRGLNGAEGNLDDSAKKRKVSFSVPESEEFDENSKSWLEEHQEALIVTAVVGGAAYLASLFLRDRR